MLAFYSIAFITDNTEIVHPKTFCILNEVEESNRYDDLLELSYHL